MLVTKFTNKETQRDVSIFTPYKIVCNGVKKTSNAKKTTSHKLETQITNISNSYGDLSPSGLLAKKVKNDLYTNKRKEARKKLK